MGTPVSEAADWHWLGRDGKEVGGNEWELVSALSTGALEPTTPVWKRGWAEWMPANRVAELSMVIPAARREPAVEPRRDPLVVKPPPRPRTRRDEALPPPRPRRDDAAQPPKLGRGASAEPSPLGAAAEKSEGARDTLPPSSFGVIGTPKPPPAAASPARPALQRARMPLPTLSDEPLHQSATATLRPPNAVPPPPRAMPTAPVEPEPERIEVTATPMPSVIVAESVQGEVEHYPSNPPPPPPARAALAATPGFVSPDPQRSLESTLDASKSPSKSAQQLALIHASRTTSPDLVHAEAAQRRSVRSAMRSSMASIVDRAKPPAIAVTGKALTALLVLSGLSGALGVLVLVLFFSRDDAPQPPAVARSEQAPPRDAPPAPGCTLAQPAARLAAAIDRTVPLNLGVAPGGKLAVGFGATKTKAAGLHIDPVAFDATQVFEADGQSALRGVIPTSKSGAASFIVDRADGALDSARSVDAEPRFAVGQGPGGFSKIVAGGPATPIWPGGDKEKITEPRVAEATDLGYLVTFRRGGQNGKVFAGWLGKDGSAKTELFEVRSNARFAGVPSASMNDRGGLVSFAGRDTPTGAWRLILAQAAPFEAPSKTRDFTPADVSGGGAISPSAAGLSGGRWFLQWTEGASGSYRVRAQVLGADLEPLGEPMLVSPKGANAGQGASWVNGVHAISLFILTTAGRDELWGAALRCE